MHKYTNLEILPNGNLKITLTEDGKNELPDLIEKYGSNDEAIILDLLEYHLCNGYSIVAPEDVGALTSSLIISEGVLEVDTATKFWWYPQYEGVSYIHNIEADGVIFTKAG